MIARLLREQGIDSVRVPPDHVVRLIGKKLGQPAIDERFDWPQIAGATIENFTYKDEAVGLLRQGLTRFAATDERLVMIFHTHESGLRLRASDVVAQLPMILGEVWEFWLVAAAESDWLIDYSGRDKQVCWSGTLDAAPYRHFR